MADLKFPMFIDLTGKKITVVGGGSVALRRIRTLQAFDADITVIAPQIHPDIRNVAGIRRGYAAGDCQGAFLVLAATDDPALNHKVAEDARALGIPANNASNQNDSDFFFPAVALSNDLSVGICGTGLDHHLVSDASKKIRSLLSERDTV